MTDRILDDLLTMQRDLEADLQRVNRAIAALRDDAPPAQASAPAAPTVNSRKKPPRRKKPLIGKDKPLVLVHAAADVLREKGRPMLSPELVPALEAKGFRLGGLDKANNLCSIMARFPGLIRNRGRGKGFWLAGEPLPGEKPTTQALDLEGGSAEPAEPISVLHLQQRGVV